MVFICDIYDVMNLCVCVFFFFESAYIKGLAQEVQNRQTVTNKNPQPQAHTATAGKAVKTG